MTAKNAMCVICAIIMLTGLSPIGSYANQNSASGSTSETASANETDQTTVSDQANAQNASDEAGSAISDTYSVAGVDGEQATAETTVDSQSGPSLSSDSTSALSTQSDSDIAITTQGTGVVSIDSMSADVDGIEIDKGSSASITSGNTFTLSLHAGGDGSLTGRKVAITIPKGLRLVSGTGIKSCEGASYTPDDLTPSQLLAWQGVPTWTNDGTLTKDGFSLDTKSGTLTYTLNDGTNGGDLSLTLQAESYLYDYSAAQVLSAISATMTDSSGTSDTAVIGITLDGSTVAPTDAVSFPSETTYLDQAQAVDVTALEPFSYLMRTNGGQGNATYNQSFDLTYAAGAVVTMPSGWTLGTQTTNPDGTVTSHVAYTADTDITVYTGATDLCGGISITYPSSAGFTINTTQTVTVSNLAWQTIALQSDGSLAYVDHFYTTPQSDTINIVEELPFDPSYSNKEPDWETYNGNDGKNVGLSYVNWYSGLYRSSTPVRLRYDALKGDAAECDNVTYVEIPTTTETANLTRIVIKYKGDSSETVWTAGSGTRMPGDITYVSAGGDKGTSWKFTPDTGKYIEYAYLEYSKYDVTGVSGHGSANGRPADDSYTGNYSSHVWSTWQADSTGTFNEVAVSDDTGFRWQKPSTFSLTETSTNYSLPQANDLYAGAQRLAVFTLKNTTGGSAGDKVKIDFNIDTTLDNVTGIRFPYSYNANAATAADAVESLTWTYEGDDTVYTWTKSSGEPQPFTAGNTDGSISAPDGKTFASFSEMLSDWNSSTTEVYGVLSGRPKSDAVTGVRSSHTMTASLVGSGSTSELCSKSAGFLWTAITKTWLGVSGDNVTIDAGSTGNLTFYVMPTDNQYYPEVTFAITLPTGVKFTGTSAEAWCQPNYDGQYPNGATLISSHDSTPAELAINHYTSGTTYLFQVNNQGATMYRAAHGRYTHLVVRVPVSVDPLASDAVYDFDQIGYFGSNLSGLYINPLGWTGTQSFNNAFGTGVTSTVVTPKAGNAKLTINKNPALVAQESIASSDGVYKTNNTSGSSTSTDMVASFAKAETGHIKLVATNTVSQADVSAYDNYVFIPIPKTGNTNVGQASAFDLSLNGDVTLTDGTANMDSYEVRYLNTTDDVSVSNAAELYAAGSTTYDANANMIAIKLVKQATGTSATIDIPVKAASVVSDNLIYDTFQARSVFYYSGTSTATYNSGVKTGYLKASYQHPDWTITFDSKGGSTVNSLTVEDGDAVGTLTTPTYTGKTFDGWWTLDGSATGEWGTQIDSTLIPTADMTVYAKWTDNKYTVKYDSAGGKPNYAAKTGVLWGDSGFVPVTEPTRAGYTFSGWKGGDVNPVESTTAYCDMAANDKQDTVTLVAQWDELPNVAIAYKSADENLGTVSSASESLPPASGVAAGSTATAKAGYHFVDWTDDNNADAEVSTDATFVPAKVGGLNVAGSYTAHFAANTDTAYQVQYYQQDATGADYTLVAADTVNATGTTDTAPSIDQKTYAGFTYDRTTYEATGKASSGTALTIAPDGSLVVKLYYNRNTHDVTYNANGHGSAPAGVTGVRFGVAIAEPVAPTEAGYSFGGWYREAACTNAWDFAADTMPDANLTLYAKWTPNNYTVSFANDGPNAAQATISGDGSQTVPYLGNATAACTVTPTDPDNYQVVGWSYDYTAADGSEQKGVVEGATGYATVPIKGDVTFHAVIFKVPFVSATAVHGKVSIANTLDDAPTPTATSAAIQGITYDTLPVAAAVRYAPENENYKLGSVVVRDFYGTSPASITLNDGVNTFSTHDRGGNPVDVTVTLDKGAGTVVTDQKIGSSLEVDVNYELISTNYMVKHYQQKVDKSGYDEVTADEQTVTANAGSEESFTPKTYSGFAYQALKTKYADSAHSTPQTDALTVKYDGTSTISLYYDRVDYTLSFDANGHGNAPDAQTLAYGATTTAPDAPTAAGYTFGGWYSDAGCTGTAVDFSAWTMPAANTVLYAKWTENDPVTMTYKSADTNAGTVSRATESVAPSTGTALGSTATAKPGYHFVSWSDDNDHGATVATDATWTPAKNTDNVYVSGSYTANFAENDPVTITYATADANMGTAIVTGTTADTSEQVLPATGVEKGGTATAKPGYDFVGWYDANGKKVSTSAIFIPAKNADGLNVAGTYTAHFEEQANVTFAYKSADSTMGTVSPASESIPPATGTAVGSTATAKPGYHFVNWTDDNSSGSVVSTDAKWVPSKNSENIYTAGSYTAHFAEDPNVVISYKSADENNGTVNPANESLAPATGTAAGSTATPATGYVFARWTDANGQTVSESETYVPAKVDGLNVAATYTANFDPSTYTVVFDKNATDATGTMDDESFTYDTAANLTQNSFVRAGYTFTGWNTKADNSGTAYSNAANVKNLVSDGTSITLYAQWDQNTYTVSYNTEGGTPSTIPDNTVTWGESGLIPAAAPTRAGYTFVGWKVDGSAPAGAPDPVTDTDTYSSLVANDQVASVTLDAVWSENDPVLITYKSSDVSMGTVSPESELVAPATGTAKGSTATPASGYQFVKWVDAQGNTVSTDAVLSQKSIDAVAKTSGAYAAQTFTAIFAGIDNVAVSKAVTNDTPAPGGQLKYTITVSNTGTAASERIWVKDYVPNNTTYVSCDSSGTMGYDQSAGKAYVTWWTQPIPAGGSVDLTMTVQVNECQDGTGIANFALWQQSTDKPDPTATPSQSKTNIVSSTVAANNSTAVTSTTTHTSSSSLPKTSDANLATIFAIIVAFAFGLTLIIRFRRRNSKR